MISKRYMVEKEKNYNRLFLYISIIFGIGTFIIVMAIDFYRDWFNILMSCVYILLCFVPLIFNCIFKWHLPFYISLSYYIFIFLATVLGTIFNLYDYIKIYDIILHTLSGVLLGGFGYYIYKKLSKDNNKMMLAIFMIIGFASISGILWEVWEFFTDAIFNFNSQRHTSALGEALVGREALKDTMYDLICDFLGSVFFAIVYAVIYSKNRRKLSKKRKP